MTPTPHPGWALRLRRQKAHIQLIEMAYYLGISAPYLYDLECGHRRLSPTRHKAYLAALRCRKPNAGLTPPATPTALPVNS